jgi:hypothetical protein
MKNDSGLLSIDFIAGFTIFLIAFIVVVTMVSGLLIGLQSRTIDYDALAYRTGVILAEDSGDPGGPGDVNDPYGPGWETKNFKSTQEKKEIIRLGLALSKYYPNILSPSKVGKFFYNNTGFADDDYNNYRQKLVLYNFNNQFLSILPTYYRFNISIRSLETGTPKESVPYIMSPRYAIKSVGDDASSILSYGYSRRLVSIKQPSSITANLSRPLGDPGQAEFTVSYDIAGLQNGPGGLRYNIDPVNDQTAINVSLNNTGPVRLIDVKTIQYFNNTGGNPLELILPENPPTVHMYLNTNIANPSVEWKPSVNDILNNKSFMLIVVDPGYLEKSFTVKNASSVSLRFTFNTSVTARSDPINYTYIPTPYQDLADNVVYYDNVTQPFLIPAVMEVKVW